MSRDRFRASRYHRLSRAEKARLWLSDRSARRELCRCQACGIQVMAEQLDAHIARCTGVRLVPSQR